MKKGAFTFVLHSHLPYARQAGRWPHGEEWLHEAAAETYIPLLNALNRLADEGVPAKLTLTLTPILLEQLNDDDVRSNFVQYLDLRIEAAGADVQRFDALGDEHRTLLAQYYLDWYQDIRYSFVDRYKGNLVPAFRALQDAGVLEIATCAATHGYLPLLSKDDSINLQLKTAVESYKRLFGRPPQAIWLPECAYRPGFVTEDGTSRAGLETFLEAHGIQLFFVETHLIEGGRPQGIAAGDAVGPYGTITRRYLVPFDEAHPSPETTTYKPYFVGDASVAVIARNKRTGLQVWSADWGYPGEFDYREFHKKDGQSGLQYWRVTGARIDLGDKDLYHPDWAEYKVHQHAEHFAHMVTEMLQGYAEQSGSFGLVSANYDTELFGHWWFEGIDWIEGVLRHLATSETVELTTAGDFIKAHPPDTAVQLPEGSWGAGGTHFVWDNTDTHWMWPMIHEAEVKMAGMITAYPDAKGDDKEVLNQAARELLLLQSSDWPFLVTTGQAREYATQRFLQHIERFNMLVKSLQESEADINFARWCWEKDKIFPDIDYRWFAA